MTSLKTNKSSKIILFSAFFIIGNACNENESGNLAEEQVKQNTGAVIERMQSVIDSAVVVCDSAFGEYSRGRDPQQIHMKYSNKVSLLEKRAIKLFEDCSQKYKRGELSQKEYDKIRMNVFTDSIKAKTRRFESLIQVGGDNRR